MKVVVVDKENTFDGCWLSDVEYPKMDGKCIHQVYAAGEGKLVRHLCSIKHCINPIHLVRGNDRENHSDERLRKRIMAYIMLKGMKIDINPLNIQESTYEELILEYTNWKTKVSGTYWDIKSAKMYLELVWKDTFKKTMLSGDWIEHLGKDIVNTQEQNASILMNKLKMKWYILIVEV